MNVYFVKLNDKIFGPFSGRKLQNMRSAGLIQETTPVSTDRNTWRPAVEYSWLFALEKAPPIHLEPPLFKLEPSNSIRNKTDDLRSGKEPILLLEENIPEEETTVPPPNTLEFFARVISLIWNPAYHVTAIRYRFKEKGCIFASVIALLFFCLSVSVSLNCLPALKALSLPLWKTILMPICPVLFLSAYTTFVHLFFGNEEIKRIRASDFLISTASLVCWGVLIPFGGVLTSYYWRPEGIEWIRSGYFVLLLFFFCCGAIISTLCFYESWTGLGTVKKTTAIYLLPFVFFFSIFLIIINF